jgi:alpha-glucosidase
MPLNPLSLLSGCKRCLVLLLPLLLLGVAVVLLPQAAHAHTPLLAQPLPAEEDAPPTYLPIARTAGGPLATLASPDGTVIVRIETTRLAAQTGQLRFSISHGTRQLVTSGRLGVTVEGVDGEGGFVPLLQESTEYRLLAVTSRSVRQSYTLAVSERSTIPNRFNEAVIALRTVAAPERRLNLIVRAYDEGVALRYQVPAQGGFSEARYLTDGTQWLFPAGTFAYEERPIPPAQPAATGGSASVNAWSEGVYARVPVNELGAEMPLPLTLDYGGGEFGAIVEGAVDNFARSSLRRVSQPAAGVALKLEGPSRAGLPYASPWRVLMIAPSAGGLLERNYLLYNLADPTPYSAAQVATFAQMAGTAIRILPQNADPLTGVGEFTTAQAREYVDFASQLGIQYVAFDTGWYGDEDSASSDPVVPQGTLDVRQVALYGMSKSPPVGVILYVNQLQLDADLERIMGQYSAWGVKGIKLGFVDGTSQSGINLVHLAVREAAARNMFVDVHDGYRPSGMTRTYPNLFTQEGVAGAERQQGAEHTTHLPFTRFIIGAADYTLPYYSSIVRTTRAHQLGLAVIFYSPLNFVLWASGPGQYEGDPGADFLASVPTTWDETRVLAGTPGEMASVARRKGSAWYIGTITNTTPRSVPLALDFLTPGVTYRARIFSEAQANVVQVQERSVVQGDVLEAAMLPSGGHAVHLIPQP